MKKFEGKGKSSPGSSTTLRDTFLLTEQKHKQHKQQTRNEDSEGSPYATPTRSSGSWATVVEQG